MDIQPVTLAGHHVRLEPLRAWHAEALFPAANEPDIWRYMPYGVMNSVEKLRTVIEDLLDRQARGTDMCFAVFDMVTDRPIGMTRYLTIDRANRGLEIGGTWYGKAYRRTATNTECKYLLLRHAFETLGCIRVQLRTDVRNVRSQRAIERLGAVREGVFRQHMIMPDGYRRSSVYYSIIEEEWPGVKARLEIFLNDPARGHQPA